MTKEQIIVIGSIAAAFPAGWIASLVTRGGLGGPRGGLGRRLVTGSTP